MWRCVSVANLARHLDDPLRRNDERRVRAERARFLDVLHGEAAHLVVVSHLAPGAADGDDLLKNIKQSAAAGVRERAILMTCRL